MMAITQNWIKRIAAIWLAMTGIFLTQPVQAIPVTTSHLDAQFVSGHIVVGNQDPLFVIGEPAPPFSILKLPKFDPGKGTLLSAELSASVELQGGLTSHCRLLGFCRSDASGSATDSLSLDPTSAELGVDLGEDIEVTDSVSANCSDTSFFRASCSDFERVQNTTSRNWTFTGDDLAGFIGSGDFNFYVDGGTPRGKFLLEMEHEGVPFQELLESAADDGGDVLAAAVLLDIIVKAISTDPLHAGSYSHGSLATVSIRRAQVDYTYEPTATIPEPGTISLFGLGLYGIHLAARRRRRAARRNA